MGKETDDAGHAIGKSLGGGGGRETGNIFPVDAAVNRGEMARLEKSIAEEVRAGREVYVEVTLKYASPYDARPTKIVYDVIVVETGEHITEVFDNL
jgi:hypothetical protein